MIYMWRRSVDDVEEHGYKTRAISDKVESLLRLLLTSVNIRKYTIVVNKILREIDGKVSNFTLRRWERLHGKNVDFPFRHREREFPVTFRSPPGVGSGGSRSFNGSLLLMMQ